jgi:tRNA-uridine 2-sulfurtransferase
VHLPEFLQQRLAAKSGQVIDIPADASLFSAGENLEELESISRKYELHEEQGVVVGKHNGAHYYTIGQRKGLNLGGFAKPLFVIGTDTEKNIIYTGMGEDHPGLYRKGLFIPVKDEHWVRKDLSLSVGESKKYMARIRYRQPLTASTIYKKEEGLYVIFDKPQKSITPGQFAAWYVDEELVGSGVIS